MLELKLVSNESLIFINPHSVDMIVPSMDHRNRSVVYISGREQTVEVLKGCFIVAQMVNDAIFLVEVRN